MPGSSLLNNATSSNNTLETIMMNGSVTPNLTVTYGTISMMEYLLHTLYEYYFNSIFGIVFNVALILLIQTKTSGYLTIENHLLHRLRMILPDNEQSQSSSKVIRITSMNEAIIKALYFYNDLDYLFFTFMLMV